MSSNFMVGMYAGLVFFFVLAGTPLILALLGPVIPMCLLRFRDAAPEI